MSIKEIQNFNFKIIKRNPEQKLLKNIISIDTSHKIGSKRVKININDYLTKNNINLLRNKSSNFSNKNEIKNNQNNKNFLRKNPENNIKNLKQNTTNIYNYNFIGTINGKNLNSDIFSSSTINEQDNSNLSKNSIFYNKTNNYNVKYNKKIKNNKIINYSNIK